MPAFERSLHGTRRDLLRLAGAGAVAASASGWFPVLADGAAKVGRKHKSCILIWLAGGPSHLDTFDLKPDAPSEVRSVFKPSPTSVPGLQLCEHLPRTAKIMHEIALIRSLTHELGNHDTGTRFLLTGNRPTPAL